MKRFILHIGFFLITFSLAAQQRTQYSFTRYAASGGLTSNEVYGVAQDQDGYMWIGTNNGLQRFDGHRYLTFRNQKNVPTSIPNNIVHQVMVDAKNNLWIVTNDGKAGIFDTKTFTYREANIRLSSPEIVFWERELIKDEYGNVFLLYIHKDLLTWNEQKNEFSAEYNFFKVPGNWFLADFYQQPGTKKYWIGHTTGLAMYDATTKQLSYAGNNTAREEVIDVFGKVPSPVHIMVDRKQRMWFDSWGPGSPLVYSFDLKNKKTILDKYSLYPLIGVYHETRNFLESSDGSIWIMGLGVFAYYSESQKGFNQIEKNISNEQGIDYVRIHQLYEDKEKNIWVATSNNGLYRFNPSTQFFTNIRFENRQLKRPAEGSVMSFMVDRDGTLLAGAWGDGLYRLNQNFEVIPLNISGFEKGNPFIWGMDYSRDSSIIWMGTQPGVFKYDTKRRHAEYFNPPAINKTVRQVVVDQRDNIWMGTQSKGLFKWDKEKGKKNFADGIRQIPGIPENSMILKLFADKDGLIWVGTSSFGLYVINPETDRIIYHFSTEAGSRDFLILNNSVSGIIQYSDSVVVVGAAGLHFFNTKSRKITKTLPMPESIPGNITAIEKDRLGYLWVSLSNGIYRVNPQSNIFIHFDRVDGIRNDHFIHSASFVMDNGIMMFGADNQFIFFDPSSVRLNDASPLVNITGFRLMNRSLSVDSLLRKKKIELEPKENSLVIEFSGLRYNGAFVILYRLEGIEKQWNVADKTHQAVYSYLPPGNYTFQVRSQDAEGKLSDTITELYIKVKPPFWKTWWFLGLVIFAAIGILYFLDRLRMQRLRAMESVRTRIATSLTEDMTNSISSINISSELAKTKIDTDKERTKEYIGQISDSSNRMVQAMYDMVWSIDPQNDTMVHTIERMKAYANEMEGLYPINIDFEVDPLVKELPLDMDHRYEILSIYKEAVNNAARHSNGRYVKVNIRFNKPKLVMLIMDDGKGFLMDDAAMLGRGISEMRRRATAINASFYIESEINTGTIVKLEIPL